MNSSKNINVLWVDDRPDLNLVEACAEDGISIEIKGDAISGADYLKRNWREIDFVILDARGTRPGDMSDGDVGGVYDMLKALAEISRDKVIPHCIYTAFVEHERVKAIKDIYTDVKVIKKNSADNKHPILSPYEELESFIIQESSKGEERKIRNMYFDVLDAADALHFKTEYRITLMDFLKSLTFDNLRDKCPKPSEIRDIFEYVFKCYYDAGLIPRECYKANLQGKLTEINITDAMRYLCGEKPDNVLGKANPLGVFDKEGSVVPSLMVSLVETALNYSQKSKHDDYKVNDPDVIDINKKLNEYESAVSSPLYKFNALLSLCDFIKFSASYISSHPDVATNKQRCVRLQEYCDKTASGTYTNYCTAKKDNNGEFHVGPYIKLNNGGKEITTNNFRYLREGDKVVISKLTINNASANDGYKYYCKDFKIK